jgi:hypothetical protein
MIGHDLNLAAGISTHALLLMGDGAGGPAAPTSLCRPAC